MKLLDRGAAKVALCFTALIVYLLILAVIGAGILQLTGEVDVFYALLFLPYTWLIFYSAGILEENL